MGKIYFISSDERIKIGFTTQSIKSRLKQIQTGNESKLYVLGYITGTMDDEKYLHKIFAKDRIRCNGEWFYPSQELLHYINKNNEEPNTYVDVIDGKIMSLLKI